MLLGEGEPSGLQPDVDITPKHTITSITGIDNFQWPAGNSSLFLILTIPPGLLTTLPLLKAERNEPMPSYWLFVHVLLTQLLCVVIVLSLLFTYELQFCESSPNWQLSGVADMDGTFQGAKPAVSAQ